MKKGNQPAGTIFDSRGVASAYGGGLSKREYFSALAMQGILANDAAVCRLASKADENMIGHETLLANAAAGMADALLAELERTGGNDEQHRTCSTHQ